MDTKIPMPTVFNMGIFFNHSLDRNSCDEEMSDSYDYACGDLQHVLQEVLESWFLRIVDDFRTALFHNNTAVHEYDLIGDFAREAYFVGDNHHGHAFFRQRQHDIQHFAHQFRIECGSRLVEQHDFRLHGKRTGDGHALLLTTGLRGGGGLRCR